MDAKVIMLPAVIMALAMAVAGAVEANSVSPEQCHKLCEPRAVSTYDRHNCVCAGAVTPDGGVP